MTKKKQMKPGEKVGLTLTQAERMLLLNAMHGLTEEIRDVMRATPTAQPVMLTLDNLDDLEGLVAAEANQTKDKKLRQRLDAISEKIQRHLDRHDDEPEVTESPATIGFLDRFVESLAGPRPLGRAASHQVRGGRGPVRRQAHGQAAGIAPPLHRAIEGAQGQDPGGCRRGSNPRVHQG